ncbi:serine/threonine protein kinase [Candidatus Uabimicrobium amorphum]|uniref:mitogen-activated protein kinase kinase n=1 Tax=Uabimicrobium amorphum TaxID=2596890 RepID=A0A5S9IMS1_UABAM|nr:serine/threonine-protein kinase [Candidatus Uabimicrobium amorphum]BBM84773.1 serine/threonine protein kinase [Candidatus Uabimicrobium amorphum]
MSISQNHVFDNYQILDEIGRGGMGVVYKCKEMSSQRIFAVKFLLQNNKAISQKRFLREAKILGNLHHPNIISVYNAGVYEGHLYIVMELLRGQTLDDFVWENWSIRERVMIIEKIAVALNYAHEKDVIHRDLKPSNIFIEENGNPKILDFGLAKSTKLTKEQLTQTHEVMGSPHYMSPEQVRGRAVDQRTDIYSLGCILFEVLSGEKMTQGSTVVEIFYNLRMGKRRSLKKLVPNVPKALDCICAQATRERRFRYWKMKEFLEDLRRYLQGRRVWDRSKTYAVAICFILFTMLFTFKMLQTTGKTQQTTIDKIVKPSSDIHIHIKAIKKEISRGDYITAFYSYQEALRLFPQHQKKMFPLQLLTLLGSKQYGQIVSKHSNVAHNNQPVVLLAIAESCLHYHFYKRAKRVLENSTVFSKEEYRSGISQQDALLFLRAKIFYQERIANININVQLQKQFSQLLQTIAPQNREKLANVYPEYYHYLGEVSLQEKNFEEAFLYMHKSYHLSFDPLTRIRMLECVPKIKRSRGTLHIQNLDLYTYLCELLMKLIEEEPMVARHHYWLGRIHWLKGKTSLACKSLQRSVELGFQDSRVLNLLLQISAKHIVRNQNILELFIKRFSIYERIASPDMINFYVAKQRQISYVADYRLHQERLRNYQKNKKQIYKIFEKSHPEAAKTILYLLPAAPEVLKPLQRDFPKLFDKSIKQFYYNKKMQLYCYYLLYLYNHRDIEMESTISKNASHIFYGILCDEQQSVLLRYLAINILLRVCNFETIQKWGEKISGSGQFIYHLALFKERLYQFEKAEFQTLWQWAEHNAPSGDRPILQALIYDILLKRGSDLLINRPAKTYLNMIYVYSRTQDDKLYMQSRQYLLNQIQQPFEGYHSTIYYYLLQRCNLWLEKNNDILKIGLKKKLFQKLALQFLLKNVDERKSRDYSSLRKQIYNIMLDASDIDTAIIAGKVWCCLLKGEKDYHRQINIFLNESRISYFARAMIYFYSLNDTSVSAYFQKYLVKKSSDELHNTLRLVDGINVVDQNLLQGLILKFQQHVFSMADFYRLLDDPKQAGLHRQLLSNYLTSPVGEQIIDFPIRIFCENPKPRTMFLVKKLRKKLPKLEQREKQARLQKRKQIRLLLNAHLAKQREKPGERQLALWMSKAIYLRDNAIAREYKKWQKLNTQRKKDFAQGFYMRLKTVFIQHQRREYIKQFLKFGRLVHSFPLNKSYFEDDSYHKYLVFFRQQIKDKDFRQNALLELNRAYDFDRTSCRYLLERAIIYCFLGKKTQALHLLNTALEIDPHDIFCRLKKIEMEVSQRNIHHQLVHHLDELFEKTTQRFLLLRIAKIYEQMNNVKSDEVFIKKARFIYEKLYMQDAYDVEILKKLVATYPKDHSLYKVWTNALQIVVGEIQSHQLPINVK